MIFCLVACVSIVGGGRSVRLELQSGVGTGRARIAIDGQIALLSELDNAWPSVWGPIAGNSQLWNKEQHNRKVGHYFALATTTDTETYPKGLKLGIFPIVKPCNRFLEDVRSFVAGVDDEEVMALGTSFSGNLACNDWSTCASADNPGLAVGVCTKPQNEEFWKILRQIGSTIPPDGPGLRSKDLYLLIGPKCSATHNAALVERFVTDFDPVGRGKPVGGWTWHGKSDYGIGRFWVDKEKSNEMKPIIYTLDFDNDLLGHCETDTPLFFVFIISICVSFVLPCGLLWWYRGSLFGGRFHHGQWYVAKNDIGKLIRQQEKRDIKRRQEFSTDVDQDIILFPPCTASDTHEVADNEEKADVLTVWTYHNNDMIKHGPYSSAEMRLHVSQGRIKARTRIRRDGWKEFLPVTSVFPRAKVDLCYAFSEQPLSEFAAAARPSAAPMSYPPWDDNMSCAEPPPSAAPSMYSSYNAQSHAGHQPSAQSLGRQHSAQSLGQQHNQSQNYPVHRGVRPGSSYEQPHPQQHYQPRPPAQHRYPPSAPGAYRHPPSTPGADAYHGGSMTSQAWQPRSVAHGVPM